MLSYLWHTHGMRWFSAQKMLSCLFFSKNLEMGSIGRPVNARVLVVALDRVCHRSPQGLPPKEVHGELIQRAER